MKLARLKLVPKTVNLTFTKRSYDPREVSPTISIDSDCFIFLNAPFSHTMIYPFALKSSRVPFSKTNMANLYSQNLILVLLKPMTKSQALFCTMRFYDPKQAPCTISSDSNCF